MLCRLAAARKLEIHHINLNAADHRASNLQLAHHGCNSQVNNATVNMQRYAAGYKGGKAPIFDLGGCDVPSSTQVQSQGGGNAVLAPHSPT